MLAVLSLLAVAAAPTEADAAAPTEAAAAPTEAAAIPDDAGPGAGAAVTADTTGASGSASVDTAPRKGLSRRRDRKWIHRWAPERHMVELGVFAGILVPARDLELFEPDPTLPRQGFRPFARVAPEIGGRVGYFPIRHFGIEVEGAGMPTTAGGERANLWTARGHFVGQLGLWSVTPFVVVGAGAMGVSSPRSVVGSDVDASLHLGLGAKFYLNRYVMLRFDVRDVITARRGVAEGATNSIEALLGLSVTLGRKRDRDAVPAKTPSPPPSDRDGDGVLDTNDRCPDVPGEAPTGCPPGDRDGDGFTDDVDACIDVPGIAPDGCPDRDPDKDGILDPDDKCPDVAETMNGFEDGDGCPDEVPTDFTDLAVLEGVFFATNSATLGKASTGILDRAVATLQKFPEVKVEISGHTDSTGNREHNMNLSQQRAESVKRYLVEHGIDGARIETRGAGPDEPIDSNANDGGRAKNRRIEFRVLR